MTVASQAMNPGSNPGSRIEILRTKPVSLKVSFMPRYCKVCGQKSGRCNHLVLDLGEPYGSKDEKKATLEGSKDKS